jgi:hypothetical protein
VALGKGVVAENGDIIVRGKRGKPGRTYPASAVVRVESRDGRTVWRRPPTGIRTLMSSLTLVSGNEVALIYEVTLMRPDVVPR